MLNEPRTPRKGKAPPSRSAAKRTANVSTMNRPDASSLNVGASDTVAAQAFAKRLQSGDASKPSIIANSYIPPVIEKAPEEKGPSPFKAASKGPIKRPKNLGLGGSGEEISEEEEKPEVKKPSGPQIAKFMDIPIIEKPASPFVPLGAQQNNNSGLKAPIKRPSSASVNHAQAKQDEDELDKIRAELDAMGGAFAKPAESEETDKQDEPKPFAPRKTIAPAAPAPSRPSAFSKSPLSSEPKPVFAPAPKPKTSDKTFVPLAPIPTFAPKKEEDEINPFKAPEKKTEEQIRKEEENARRALEQSRTEPKKSRLDKLMDNLNRPIF